MNMKPWPTINPFEDDPRPYGFDVIEGGKEARDTYGHAYGSCNVILTEEDIKALREGKQLVHQDGEYHHFVMLGE